MSDTWLRQERTDLAIDRILDAAEQVFVGSGIISSSMAQVADVAGCSRATLYRYFADKEALQLAYVNREAIRLAEEVKAHLDGLPTSRQLVAGVLLSVRMVRESPALSTWFAGVNLAVPLRLLRDSVVPSLVAEVSADSIEADLAVRLILSLLTIPATDGDVERQLVERALLGT